MVVEVPVARECCEKAGGRWVGGSTEDRSGGRRQVTRRETWKMSQKAEGTVQDGKVWHKGVPLTGTWPGIYKILLSNTLSFEPSPWKPYLESTRRRI